MLLKNMAFWPGPMLNLPFQFLTQIFPPFSLQFCTCLFLESLSGHSDVHFWLGTSAVEVGGSGEALVASRCSGASGTSLLPRSYQFHISTIKMLTCCLKMFLFLWVFKWILQSSYLCACENFHMLKKITGSNDPELLNFPLKLANPYENLLI